MKKPPPNLPAEGDEVRMRGRGQRGTLKHVTPDKWCMVEWHNAFSPKICHLYELERDAAGQQAPAKEE